MSTVSKIGGLAWASVKTVGGLAAASIKTVGGLAPAGGWSSADADVLAETFNDPTNGYVNAGWTSGGTSGSSTVNFKNTTNLLTGTSDTNNTQNLRIVRGDSNEPYASKSLGGTFTTLYASFWVWVETPSSTGAQFRPLLRFKGTSLYRMEFGFDYTGGAWKYYARHYSELPGTTLQTDNLGITVSMSTWQHVQMTWIANTSAFAVSVDGAAGTIANQSCRNEGITLIDSINLTGGGFYGHQIDNIKLDDDTPPSAY